MAGIPSLAIFIAMTAGAAVWGSQFKPGPWYAALAKPEWTPPNWLFAPVWTVLYVMIAVAGWLVWRAEGLRATLAVWGVQLALNAAWTWTMFDQHRIGAALVNILLLWLAICAFIFLSWNVSRWPAYLFVPYWIWVSYASALNFAIWRLSI